MARLPSREMTKSALSLASKALETGRRAVPDHSHRNSPRKFTQPQMFAVLAVREMFHVDFPGMEQLLKDWSDLREALDLKAVPDYSTLCRAHERLLKKALSTGSWRDHTARTEPQRSRMCLYPHSHCLFELAFPPSPLPGFLCSEMLSKSFCAATRSSVRG